MLQVLLLSSGCDGGTAQAEDFLGQWDVNTTLVAASAATNPDYKEGDLRVEVWTIAQGSGGATLTSSQGAIDGQITGTTAVFDALVDTGLNLKMKVHIECFLTSSGSMKGTIKAEYYGTFDNYVGLDSWSFEAVKR